MEKQTKVSDLKFIHYDYHVSIDNYLDYEIEGIRINFPGEAKLEEGFSAYAVLCGDFPLKDRRIDEIEIQLEESFGKKILINNKSYDYSASFPDKVSGYFNYKQGIKTSHYFMPLLAEDRNDVFLLHVIPFDMINFYRNNESSTANRVLNAHELISHLGSPNSESYTLPWGVMGAPRTTKEADLWSIVRNYCEYFGIHSKVIPPDLSKYN